MGFARRGSNPLGVAFFTLTSKVWPSKINTYTNKLSCHYSLVVERQPCKLKVLGSIPSGGFLYVVSCFIFDPLTKGNNGVVLWLLTEVSLPEWLRGWT